jgi:pimeloyl-ACP methyl ester carboxylesterase
MRGKTRLRTAVRDGLRLRYTDHGTGASPLVFLHGWGCDHEFFAPQLTHFAQRYRVLALDQRGFGESDKPQLEYTLETFADDLAWLCAERGIERTVLVGHSMGGAVALVAAGRHPALVRAIALCDPAVFLPEESEPLRRQLVAGLATPHWRETARAFIEQYLFIESDDPERRRWITERMCSTPQHVLHSAFRHLVALDSAQAAAACRVPVLCIGAAQTIVREDAFRAACPQLEMAHTPAAGHFHQLEAPDEVNALLERFLAELAARSPVSDTRPAC